MIINLLVKIVVKIATLNRHVLHTTSHEMWISHHVELYFFVVVEYVFKFTLLQLWLDHDFTRDSVISCEVVSKPQLHM